LLSLGKVHLEAVEPGEVPCRAGKWNSHFLVDPPDIPVHTEALPVHRANGAKGVIERIPITGESRRVVLAADCKRHRTGGGIEQVTVKSAIINRQFILTGGMQRHINGTSGLGGVRAMETPEGIKRRAMSGTRQRLPPEGLA